MRKIFLSLLIILHAYQLFSQVGTIKGIVLDAETGESLIGANVLIAQGVGTVTDLDGNFSFSVNQGEYTLNVSYVGYETITRQIVVTGEPLYFKFRMESLVINEVTVVADVARSRETPVAFSTVLPKKLHEELAGQDIPMVLNSTPGVYATQLGGGDGDARITIRGFNQRNIAVMIDGIPVNDMENGWVYWSNWFGLDAVTRTIQVQRGLGASKLALPSVGGTLNILTKGIENKKETGIKQEIDSQGKIRTSFGHTSGKMKNGWGITLAGSYKRGNGWVDQTFSEGWFYYAKIDKRFNDHIVSLSAMGAPQHHQQRSYSRSIATYDLEYAKELGVDINTMEGDDYLYRPTINNMGINYNQHWGRLKRDRFNPDAKEEVLHGKVNVYHKPQFSLRDFWRVNDKFSISNIAYLSLGTGGGIRSRHSIKETQKIADPEDPHCGQIDWQSIYNANAKPTQTPFGEVLPINTKYSETLFVSDNYMTERHNDHIWYGLLSTGNYKMNNSIDISGGIDIRSYTGIHYTTVTDLLGGDYVVDVQDSRNNYQADSSLAMKYEGDMIQYYYKGLVNWGGIFGQVEYKTPILSAFVNVTSAVSGYKKIDYFADTQSAWKWKPGFTIKGGANYNITEHSNFFMNLGFLSKTRAYKYFYKGFTTEFAENLENEQVKAIELGYHYSSHRFSANINAYYTSWINKPTNRVYSTHFLQPGEQGYDPDDPEGNEIRVYADIPGMDALHMGIELDFIYKIMDNLDFQGLVSLGDWTWDKKVKDLQFYNYDSNDPVNMIIDFDATGIHVGDAAQTQLGASIRYEPIKGLYMNTRFTYFGRYYSDFSPESTTGDDGNPVDSWKIPDYEMLDLHTGYRFKISKFDKVLFNLRFSMLNVLDRKYISDATNNDSFNSPPFQDFDAKSATVFFGMGRRFITSLKITF